MVLDYLLNTLQLRCKANAESSLLVMLSCSPQCIILMIQRYKKFLRYANIFLIIFNKKGTKGSDPFAPF